MKKDDSFECDDGCKVDVMGDKGSGKSALIKFFSGQQKAKIIENGEKKILFSVFEKKDGSKQEEDTNSVIWVIDGINFDSFKKEDCLKKLKGTPVLFVVSKSDLLNKDEIQKIKGQDPEVMVINIKDKKNSGIDEAFLALFHIQEYKSVLETYLGEETVRIKEKRGIEDDKCQKFMSFEDSLKNSSTLEEMKVLAVKIKEVASKHTPCHSYGTQLYNFFCYPKTYYNFIEHFDGKNNLRKP